jgi:hypothetical protein
MSEDGEIGLNYGHSRDDFHSNVPDCDDDDVVDIAS